MKVTPSVDDASQKVFAVDQFPLHQFQIGGKGSDVTIKVRGLSMRCHKRVLEAMSPYFERKFNTHLKDNNTNIVDLEADNEGGIKSLIEMAYSNQLIVNVNKVQDIVVAADYLLMDKPKLFCEEFLIEELDASNVFGFLHFGLLFNLRKLVVRADKFIACNFVECSSGDEFLSLEKDEVVSLISRSYLEVKSEEDIFKSLKVWINHSFKIRSQSMFELLQQVRLAVIMPEYFAKVIANFPACKSSTGCQELIRNAELYHSSPSVYNVVDIGERRPRGFPSGKIYLSDSNSALSFLNNKYKEVKAINNGLFGKGFAAIDKKIYTTGGRHSNPETRDMLSTNQVNVYSPDESSCSTLMPAMNCQRAHHACCSHAGDLFVSGGKNGKFSTCCEKLIIKEGKWMFVAEMNEARLEFQMVSCGKYIWVLGGKTLFGSVLNTTEYYDDVNDKWTMFNPMIEERYGHSAVAFREDVYVVGGHDGVKFLRSSEKLDTTNRQWTAISSMKIPRGFFGAAINEHKLYCFGGNLGRETKVEYLNLYSGDWIEEGVISIESYFTSAITVFGV